MSTPVPLPKYLPAELESIRQAASEKALLFSLSSTEKRVLFLRAALDDRDYCESGLSVIKTILGELSKQYSAHRLDEVVGRDIAELLYGAQGSIKAVFPRDLTIAYGDRESQVMALLFGVASDHFRVRLISAIEKKVAVIRLESKQLEGCEELLRLIQDGTSDLPRLPVELIKNIAKLAKEWGCTTILEESQEALAGKLGSSILSGDEWLPLILYSLEMGYPLLLKRLIERFNEAKRGFQLRQERVGLVAHFFDLKSTITLGPFMQIAPYVKGIKLEKEVTQDENLDELMILVKSILWLDLSDTLAPPNFDLLPGGIRNFILDRVEWLDDDIFQELLERYRSIEGLSIRESHGLTYLSFGAIGRLPLHYLDVSYAKNMHESDFMVMKLGFSGLEALGLAGCKQISIEGLKELLHAAPRLEFLDLSKTAANDSLFSDFKALRYLKTLVCDKTAISKDRLEQWKSAVVTRYA